MKKVLMFALWFCIPTITLMSQTEPNFSYEKGKVTQYEMSMTEYVDDADAEAVVIYEIGDYRFSTDDQRGFILDMTIRKKIKILNQAGIKYADIEIPYYIGESDVETINHLEAVTYNFIDGKLTKTELQKSNVFEEKINKYLRQKKFAMPNVREGSVIEISYTISTPFYFNMREWDFQKKIPVIHSHLEYRAIPYYEYAYILKGATQFDKYDSEYLFELKYFGLRKYREMLHSFEINNIPAFRDEEFITSPKDYMISLNFQMAKTYSRAGAKMDIMTTWPKICDELLKDESFGKFIKNSEKNARKILPTLSLTDNKLSNLEIITNYVKANYKWNEFLGKYAVPKFTDFEKEKIGNSASINLYLTGFLKAAGLNVTPIVLSTRGHGTLSKDHPFLQFLNYTIAMVEIDGENYFIDATDPLLYYQELPTRSINVVGLAVKPKSEEWVNIVQTNMKHTHKSFDIKIESDKNLMNIDAKYTATGNDGYFYRRVYDGKVEDLADYLKKTEKVNLIGDISVVANKDVTQPFEFGFNFNFPVENTGDKLFIQPFCNLSILDNPFKQTSRKLPIQLIYVKGEDYSAKIEIPKGYKVEYLPTKAKVSNKIISIQYSAVEKDGFIEVNGGYNFSSNQYPAQAYIPLKVSIAEAIKKFSEMIVLVKEQEL